MKNILLLLVLTLSCAFASRTITDQLGRNVVLPDEVNKIVVLQHQSLNVLNEINALDKVVGVLSTWEGQLGKDYIHLAPSLKNKPTPGDLKSINYEEILKLKPDVIIVTNYMPKEHMDKMEALKIPVVAISFFKGAKYGKNSTNPEFNDTIKAYDEGFYEGVDLLGKVSNHEKEAKELIDYVKKSQNELKKYTQQIKDKISVYVANPNLTTYGSGKYTEIFFKRAGGDNVASKYIKGYKQVNPESVLLWNPDVIFVQNRYPDVIDELKNNQALSNLKAIKNDNIYLMPQYAKAWGYPTPEAMAIGEFWVAKKLYPEILKDFDLDKKVSEFYNKFYRADYQR